MNPDDTPESFEAAMAALNTLVQQMEEGQMPLEQSLEAYRQGTELLKYCQSALQQAEQQIRVLDEQNNLQPLTLRND